MSIIVYHDEATPIVPMSLERQIMSLFANDAQGGMWDFTDPDGLYQDARGTTPITALGQPMGLVLDRRFGLVRGEELVPPPSEWTTVGTAQVIDGKMVFSDAGAGDRVEGSLAALSGRTYEVRSVIEVSAGSVVMRTPVGAIVLSNGEHSFIATASSSGSFRLTGHAISPTTATVHSISIREIPGNHLSQSTTAARPTYTEDGALHDGVDDFLAAANAADWTFLHDGTGGFMGASSIYLGEAGNSSGYYGTQTAGGASIGISQGQQNVNLARSHSRLAGDGGVLSLPSSGTGSMPVGVVASEMIQHANSHIVHWLNGVECGDTPYDGFVPSANDPAQAITTHVVPHYQPLVRRRIIAISRVLTDPERAIVNAWLMEGVA